jgi:hypothetical protein
MKSPDPELVTAIGAMLRSDPQRALAVADTLRGPGRWIESTVSGWSMGSSLPPGSRIRIALAPHGHHEAGKVIAYLSDDQVIVHRVFHSGRFGAARGRLITCGDTTVVPDPPVEVARVLGPVTGVWRAGQWAPLPDPPRRSARAALARSVLSALAITGLYVSPAATARALGALYRRAGMLRAARAIHLHERS